jgi:hypothetical protein
MAVPPMGTPAAPILAFGQPLVAALAPTAAPTPAAALALVVISALVVRAMEVDGGS